MKSSFVNERPEPTTSRPMERKVAGMENIKVCIYGDWKLEYYYNQLVLFRDDVFVMTLTCGEADQLIKLLNSRVLDKTEGE